MRKLIILLALVLCSCGGPNDNLEKYHAVCYNYGEVIYDGYVYPSGGWRDENNNRVILPDDCIITQVKNER